MTEYLRNIAQTFPSSAGVYLMKDESGAVIYIGKAKNLKNRVSSYFSGQDGRYQIKFLLNKVKDIETIVTETEEQSLLLERDLINKHKPRYNIRLKDDKNFLSIRIDESSPWPKPELVRRIENDGARYFGPYAHAFEVRELLDLINQTIPLRTCSDTVFYNRQRPCLEYQIKRCAAPCCLAIDPVDYVAWLKQAIGILNGKTKEVTAILEQKMQSASDNLNFEDAAIYRDRIEILKNFKTGQKYISQGTENQDVFAFYREESLLVLAVMQVRNGRISYNSNYSFDNVDLSDEVVLQSLIEQYYQKGRDIPETIICSVMPENFDLIIKYLSELTQQKINLIVPQKGLKSRLLKLAELNAQKHFELVFLSQSNIQNITKELALKCRLKQIPRKIECIDISNLQGSDIVGAVVSFFDGRPDKQNYKKYKISFQDKPDDFAAIKEVVLRRLANAQKTNNYPDLLIIDGGKIQLDFALQAVNELKLNLDIIALAKERKSSQKPERIYLPGESEAIVLKPGKPLTKFIARIRDEVHRFVITYHRGQRSRRVFTSVLDEIPGIGAKRKKLLLNAFGSVAGIQKASPEAVSRAGKMSLDLAKRVLQVL